MKENEYLLLLNKKFQGEITASEEASLSDWIAQSAENERIATDYALIWAVTGKYEKTFSPDLDADFAKVQSRIRSEASPKMGVRFFNPTILRAAAAVALLLLAVWGVNKFGTTPAFDAVAEASAEKQLVNLPDGTQVWLRKGSSLQYFNSFSDKKERHVKLIGEGYFEVSHDPKHPFHVDLAGGGAVEVLGTQFDVCQNSDGITVLVRSGKVRFSPDGHVQSPVLTANQKAVFDAKTNTLKISNTQSLNDIAWQAGGLEFISTPLSTVVADLEKYYHVNIKLRNPAIANCPHNAQLSNEPLGNVLEGLALAYQLKVVQTGSESYELTGGVCK